MVVGITDEAQSTITGRRTAREVLHISQDLVERTLHIIDIAVPGSEHLRIGGVRLSDELSIIFVDFHAHFRCPRVWEVVFQLLNVVGSPLGQLLHDVEGDQDLSSLLFVGAGFVPVKVPVIGLLRTDSRKYPGFFNAVASDRICVWILLVRVCELLSVVSGLEQDV